MDYAFRSQARKDLKKLSPDLASRIIKKLDYFVSTPSPLDFAEPLVNFNLGHYRFRVGDYRIIFDLVDDRIVILEVGHRREINK